MPSHDLTIYRKGTSSTAFQRYDRWTNITEKLLTHHLARFCWERWDHRLPQPPSNVGVEDIKYFFKHMKNIYKYTVITRPAPKVFSDLKPGGGELPADPDSIDLTPGEIMVLNQAISIGIDSPATLAFQLRERHNIDVPKEEIRRILARIHEELAK